jgi:hypothetical protein
MKSTTGVREKPIPSTRTLERRSDQRRAARLNASVDQDASHRLQKSPCGGVWLVWVRKSIR